MLISNPTGEIGSDSLLLKLSDISPNDRPWDTHKAMAEKVADLYRQIGYDRYDERVRECAEWLEYALQTAERGEMCLKLFSARFCRVRCCSICQWRRSLMWRARSLKKMPVVIADYPKAQYIFLTLTVRNCPVTELRQTIKLMNNAWNRLRGRKDFPAIGFIKSLEVTKEEKMDGYAHPHFHCFLMVSPSYFTGRQYLSHKKWVELWRDCLKVNYDPSVRIKKVKPKKGADVGKVEALVAAICETLKYTVKESDLVADPEWLGEITRQLHKLRAVSVGGIFKEYFSEDDPEDLIHGDIEPEEGLENAPKLVFDWSKIIKGYVAR